MNRQMKRWQRIALLVGLPILIALACAYVYYGLHGLRCVFYELTGFYCPGCGSGRALYSLMHGDWRSAFGYNCLFLPIGVPAVLVFLHEFLRVTIPGLHFKPVYIPQWLAVGCCVLIFLFWILRNLPAFAFLAP